MNKAERLAAYIANVDSYIKHQMTSRSEAERRAFRERMIAQYDDKLEQEKYRIGRILEHSLRTGEWQKRKHE